MKYKLKSLSVNIGGKVFRKSDNVVFDTDKKHKGLKPQIESAYEAGFLEKVKDTKSEEEAKAKKSKNDKK